MRLNKTLIGVVGSFIMLFIIPTDIYADNTAIVTSDNLNIRSGPGTDFDIIGQANTDEMYPIIMEQGEWVEIQLEAETGWVTTAYITIKEESVESDSIISSTTDKSNSINTEKTIIIQFDNTQLRKGPSTEFEITRFAEKGTQYDVISEEENWYEVSKGDFTGYVSKQLVHKNSNTSPSSGGIKDKTIMIDAGHGGRDVGAIGATGIYEKDITYLTAKVLEHELSILGANVLLTRPEDEFVSLESRASFSNISETDAFISVHYNSVPELPHVTGIETYYYHEQDKDLAQYIQQEIIKQTDSNNRGTTQNNYLVIRQNFKPSVLIELGFISNQEKEALLGTAAYQQNLVSGIVNGLRKYFSE